MPTGYHPSNCTMKLRHFLLVLLVLATGILHGQTTKKSVKQWEPEIRNFELYDKTNPPPANSVLFVGSSSFRIWKTTASDFPEYKVINRGFGGSQIAEINYYFGRIVKPYSPKTIVFYAGDNDLSQKTPETVLQDFKTFADKVHWAFPKTPILFVSIKPSVARWKNKEKIMKTNRLIETYARETDYIHFIDIFPAMLDKEGNPRPELFLKDGLHMNRKGYEIWIASLKPALKEFHEGKKP